MLCRTATDSDVVPENMSRSRKTVAHSDTLNSVTFCRRGIRIHLRSRPFFGVGPNMAPNRKPKN
jgi:hypothetical protein